MSCKPESKNQRLERIAVQVLAGYCANPSLSTYSDRVCAANAISAAKELIKQLDEQAEAD